LADVSEEEDPSDSTALEISDSYENFFDMNFVNKAIKCTVDSCELLQSDCVTAFTETTKVYMNTAWPFEIFLYKNLGTFSFDLCVKCTHEANVPTGESR
jgi:hypothetical protein